MHKLHWHGICKGVTLLLSEQRSEVFDELWQLQRTLSEEDIKYLEKLYVPQKL